MCVKVRSVINIIILVLAMYTSSQTNNFNHHAHNFLLKIGFNFCITQNMIRRRRRRGWCGHTEYPSSQSVGMIINKIIHSVLSHQNVFSWKFYPRNRMRRMLSSCQWKSVRKERHKTSFVIVFATTTTPLCVEQESLRQCRMLEAIVLDHAFQLIIAIIRKHRETARRRTNFFR